MIRLAASFSSAAATSHMHICICCARIHIWILLCGAWCQDMEMQGPAAVPPPIAPCSNSGCRSSIRCFAFFCGAAPMSWRLTSRIWRIGCHVRVHVEEAHRDPMTSTPPASSRLPIFSAEVVESCLRFLYSGNLILNCDKLVDSAAFADKYWIYELNSDEWRFAGLPWENRQSSPLLHFPIAWNLQGISHSLRYISLAVRNFISAVCWAFMLARILSESCASSCETVRLRFCCRAKALWSAMLTRLEHVRVMRGFSLEHMQSQQRLRSSLLWEIE